MTKNTFVHGCGAYGNLSHCVIERPDFGEKQIRSVQELRVGERLTRILSERDEHERLELLGVEGHWIRCRFYYNSGGVTEDRYSLADSGVVAYDGGLWNRTNYLVHGWSWWFRLEHLVRSIKSKVKK